MIPISSDGFTSKCKYKFMFVIVNFTKLFQKKIFFNKKESSKILIQYSENISVKENYIPISTNTDLKILRKKTPKRYYRG